MNQVWLITGSSRGLGRQLAEAVLAEGHRLLATARDPSQLADLVDRYGARIRAFALDVTDEQAARDAINAAVEAVRTLSWRAAHAVDAHTPGALELALHAKVFGSGTAVRIIKLCGRTVD